MTTLPPEDKLLSRDDFRELALVRDGGLCVICGAPATEVHHIIERRLFVDRGEEGGYFLANAASVCNPCHRRCEMTLASPAEVREAAGIRKLVVPAHLYDDGIEAWTRLTKWGDIELTNGQRSPGELFGDESVQRILREGDVLDRYRLRFRYPRTYHVPFSPGATKDDRILHDLASFAGKRVIVSEKRDGEATSMYGDGYVHARSIDGPSHPSQSRVRALAGTLAGQIPYGWRICGENLQAKHAIQYRQLSSYFQAYSIWNERNEALPWDETVEWCALLGLETVPVLYDGTCDEAKLRRLYHPTNSRGDEMEGWVIRVANGFAARDFAKCVAKWVRSGHVVTHAKHWRRGPIEENELG